ncbi:MAG: class IV adenylate cyclase [Nanoarchaeota archaeon]
MAYKIIEIKASCNNHDYIRYLLKSKNASFIGLDHQIDIYFNISHGRLKLRKGNIENNLIYYERENQVGPKLSKPILFKSNKKPELEEILTKSLGVLIVVDKIREIYFIENIKFHLDNVKNLGSFVEIEAINQEGRFSEEKLLEQCKEYMSLFKIQEKNLISGSYGDLLLKKLNK